LAQNHHIDLQLLEELPDKETMKWVLFLKEKGISIIEKYSNTLTSKPDKLS